MRLRWGVWVGIACLLVASAAQAASCESAVANPSWVELSAPTVSLRYRFSPRVGVGTELGLEVIACPLAGAVVPEALRIDARMPAHGHGMNYRPKATQLAAGHYRFDGLLLHMPGQWQLIVDVVQAGQRTRLTTELELAP